MKEPSPIQSAWDSVRRRPLSPEEIVQLRQSLKAAPETHAAWEEEQGLSLLLERLPHAPVPPRFTEQVVAALDATAHPGHGRITWWNRFPGRWPLPSWAPGMAAALAVLAVSSALWFYRGGAERTRAAHSVVHIAQPVHQVGLAVRLSGVEIFRDFEAIDRMRQLSSLADEELLASLEFAAP